MLAWPGVARGRAGEPVLEGRLEAPPLVGVAHHSAPARAHTRRRDAARPGRDWRLVPKGDSRYGGYRKEGPGARLRAGLPFDVN